jgi:hypothetical protein
MLTPMENEDGLCQKPPNIDPQGLVCYASPSYKPKLFTMSYMLDIHTEASQIAKSRFEREQDMLSKKIGMNCISGTIYEVQSISHAKFGQ